MPAKRKNKYNIGDTVSLVKKHKATQVTEMFHKMGFVDGIIFEIDDSEVDKKGFAYDTSIVNIPISEVFLFPNKILLMEIGKRSHKGKNIKFDILKHLNR